MKGLIGQIRDIILTGLLFMFLVLWWIVISVLLLIPRALLWWIFDDLALFDSIKLSFNRFKKDYD